MGYRNRTIRHDFDDLGDDIHVVIRNPKLCTIDQLTPRDVKEGDTEDMKQASAEVLARLVIQWHVPDPEDEADDAPSMPHDVESMLRAPVEVFTWLSSQLSDAFGKTEGEDSDPN